MKNHYSGNHAEGGEEISVRFYFGTVCAARSSTGHHTHTAEGTRHIGFDGLPATKQVVLHPTDVGVSISQESGAVSGSDY